MGQSLTVEEFVKLQERHIVQQSLLLQVYMCMHVYVSRILLPPSDRRSHIPPTTGQERGGAARCRRPHPGSDRLRPGPTRGAGVGGGAPAPPPALQPLHVPGALRVSSALCVCVSLRLYFHHIQPTPLSTTHCQHTHTGPPPLRQEQHGRPQEAHRPALSPPPHHSHGRVRTHAPNKTPPPKIRLTHTHTHTQTTTAASSSTSSNRRPPCSPSSR